MQEFLSINPKDIPNEEMHRIYAALRTPYKYGAVIKLEDAYADSPSVFRYHGRWYMYYASIARECASSGYTTHLAESDDLLHWRTIGTIFDRRSDGEWDSRQIAGYAALTNTDWEGDAELRSADGRYYISYLAGATDGYEPDPLYMGLAFSADPLDGSRFTRLSRPILSPEDPDSREYEKKTLYKSFIFADDRGVTGHRFVNAYNAKHIDDTERIFLAVSDYMRHWERYGDGPVLDDITGHPGARICGDPQILRVGDLYVLLYFRLDSGRPAYNTFAVSRDLVHWTKWTGEPLIQSEYDWEDCHAHKPWIVRADGVVYHYYCAVNSRDERFIAVAASKPL